MSSVSSTHCLAVTLISLSIGIVRVSPIPIADLDIEGYPTDFEVSGYACTGHFWFQQEWIGGKRKYTMYPPYQPDGTDDRWIFWSNNEWQCYKPQNAITWTHCSHTNLFDCNNGIAIRYEISAPQSAGWYRRLNTDINGFNYYQRETTLDRVVFYDINASKWCVSDESNRATIYATCTSVNLFQCEWVQTGLTAAPTRSPTNTPTQPSVHPTPHSPTSKPSPNPTYIPTQYPTSNPTINPTQYPTSNPTINPTQYPTPNPTISPALTGNPTSIPSGAPIPTLNGLNLIVLPCGEDATGLYNDRSITFHTTMQFKGQLIFDAHASTFPITHIEVFGALHELLIPDSNQNQTVSITASLGIYTFVITGDIQSSGIYHAKMICIPIVTSTENPFTYFTTQFQREKEIVNELNNFLFYILFVVLMFLICCFCLYYVINCTIRCVLNRGKQKKHKDQAPMLPNVNNIAPLDIKNEIDLQTFEPSIYADKIIDTRGGGVLPRVHGLFGSESEPKQVGTEFIEAMVANLRKGDPLQGTGEPSVTLSVMSRSAHVHPFKTSDVVEESVSGFRQTRGEKHEKAEMNSILDVVKSQFSTSRLDRKQIESDSEGDDNLEQIFVEEDDKESSKKDSPPPDEKINAKESELKWWQKQQDDTNQNDANHEEDVDNIHITDYV